MNTRIVTAVLLTAGRGIRLRPHTDSTPKPLLPWRGKPTLFSVLESLELAGIERIIIVTRHLEHQIRDFIALERDTWKMDIICVSQSELSGTATALNAAITQKPEWFDESFLVTATDYLVENDFYGELISHHQQHGYGISVSLKELEKSELAGRSSVRYTDDFVISEVVEKPAPGTEPSNYSANLTFVLPASIIPVIQSVQASARGEKEIQSAVNDWIRQNEHAKGLLQSTPLEWSVSISSSGSNSGSDSTRRPE